MVLLERLHMNSAWAGTLQRCSEGRLWGAMSSMLHCQCGCPTCTLLFMKRMTMPSSSNMVATCSHSK